MQVVEVPIFEHATSEYLSARRALLTAEMELRDQIEAVAAQRRKLPAGPTIKDFEFTDAATGGKVKLSELFSTGDALLVYNMMYAPDDEAPCRMCTMWVDGYNGVMRQLSEVVPMAIISRAPVEKLRALRDSRGWNRLRLLSAPAEYSRLVGTENEDGSQNPILCVFRRSGNQISLWYRASAEFPDEAFNSQRGIDLLSPVWNLLDLLPAGRGDWYPAPVTV
jgi:predicted dithiol-disulfide oxidoreductase (DUF899 family)